MSLSFGQWLKQRRKSLDLSQEELAERIGCSDIAIRKIEAGERRPSKQLADLLADLLNVPAGEKAAFLAFARNLDGEAAPAQAVPGRPTNQLPARLTSLVGREDVAGELGSQLLRDEVRLLSLIGPPGIGKTSLSIHLALGLLPHFRDGAYFVALAHVFEPAMVTTIIAKMFDLTDSGHRPLEEVLTRLLSGKQILLVLDNFEQVIKAASSVVNLLETCPHVKVIVTSREPLHVRGERLFRVPALQLPDMAAAHTPENLLRSPAVALFVERARAIEPDFVLTQHNADAVATICVGLEGLPLAIELAASRVRTLKPQEIQARLGGRLTLLSHGPRDLPARQQTLRAAIEWSYTLLSEGEQKLFARLGVFVGGFTLLAVEAVCNARGDLPFDVVDGLESLLDKSLLTLALDAGQGPQGSHRTSRFAMLDMLREYAIERLGALETEEESAHPSGLSSEGQSIPSNETRDSSRPGASAIRQQHAEYFLALAEGAEMQLRGPQQVDWLHRLEEEHNNIRAALHWALESMQVELALGLAGSLWKFWELHGHLSEGRRWLALALAGAAPGTDSTPRRARAKALFAAGRLAERQGDNLSAGPLLKEGITIAREIDDKPLIALILHNLSNLATYEGDYANGRMFAEESLAIRTELGDRWGMANVLHNLGFQATGMDDNESAGPFFEQSLAISRELEDDWGTAYSLDGLGHVKLEHGDYMLANALLKEGLELRRGLGDKSGIARSLERIARVEGRDGRPMRAALLFGAADALRENEDIPIMPVDTPSHELSLAQARNQLNETEWMKAWQEGRAMSIEQAITYALDDLAPY